MRLAAVIFAVILATGQGCRLATPPGRSDAVSVADGPVEMDATRVAEATAAIPSDASAATVDVQTDTGCQEANPCPPSLCCATPICAVDGACACPPAACDDGNACTEDECAASGCAHVALLAKSCDDGDDCTLSDTCKGGACSAGTALACDDGDACTDNVCAAGGCKAVPNVAPCSDGNACTVGDNCVAGECIAGDPVNCDLGSPCSSAWCDSTMGCLGMPLAATCSDDANSCTADTCVAGICVHLPKAATPCSDGNACTTGDSCGAGVCLSGGVTACNDGSVCTVDSCSAQTGCVFAAVGGACSDGVACTDGDKCVTGQCFGQPKIWTMDLKGLISPFAQAIARSIGGDGSAILYYGDQKPWLARLDNEGHVQWSVTPAQASEVVTPRMGGWAVLTNTMVQFYDDAGKLVSVDNATADFDNHFSWTAAPAQDGIIVVSRHLKLPAVACRFLRRVDPVGGTLATADLPSCDFWGTPSRIQSRTAGDYVTGSIDAKGQRSIIRFDIELAKLDYWPIVTGWTAGVGSLPKNLGHIQVFERADESLVVASTILNNDLEIIDDIFIGIVSKTGVPLWNITIAWPTLGESAQVVLGLAPLTDNGVSVIATAYTKPKSTAFGWRIDANGAVQRRTVETDRRSGGGVVPSGPDLLCLATMFGDKGSGTFLRLTQSDAFGNLTCAESGACFDKPASFCDDANACTNDLCAAATGCTHDPFPEGTPCKPGKTCKKGACAP